MSNLTPDVPRGHQNDVRLQVAAAYVRGEDVEAALLAFNRGLSVLKRENSEPRVLYLEGGAGDFTQERTALAYRLARWSLYCAGRIQPGQTLRDALDVYAQQQPYEVPEAVWVFGADVPRNGQRDKGPLPVPGRTDVLALSAMAQNQGALVPPRLAFIRPPGTFRVPIHPGLFCDSEEALAPNRGWHFVEHLRLGISVLGMRKPNANATEHGLLGIDPEHDVDPHEPPEAHFARCCLYWPTPEDLFEFEAHGLNRVAEQISEYSLERDVKGALHTQFGLTHFEQQDWFLTARRMIVDLRPISLEVERAVILRRLDEVAALACAVGDYRAQLAAVRESARVTGVTRDAPESIVDEMAEAIHLEAARRDALLLEQQEPT